MSKVKSDVKLNDLILLIIILLLTIISLIMYLRETVVKNQNEDEFSINSNVVRESEETEEKQQVSVPQTDEEIIKYLSGLGERDRMEYYCGRYFKCIQHKEYEEAYNMLYSEFKQNYFPTIEEYTEYIESFYPEYLALKYDDITRQGDIYVLRLKIIDAVNSKNDEENIQRIVIKENYYNDFVLSFQVK